jgi:hypothetical protein
MKYTRKDYMNDKCSHREYYSQFVNDNVKGMVNDRIGIDRIKKSKDEHLNDIPLKEWDMCGLPYGINTLLKSAGDGFSMAGQVCILKEAAKQLIED